MSTQKEQRINLRSSTSEKKLIQTAARLSNIKPAQFAKQAILEKAQRIVTDANTFTLSEEKWKLFVEALDGEPKEIPAIKKLLAKKTCVD